jgi:hypothetical protein
MDVYESARRAGAEDASSALPVEPSGSVNNRTMTKEQYAQYTMTRGRSIKEQVDALLKDPAFMALPDYSAEGISKFAVLQKVYRLASKKAEAEFTITNPLP